MSFGVLNIDMTFQISNKILFEKTFGDTLTLSVAYKPRKDKLINKG